MRKIRDAHQRSVAKAITWRVIASLSTMTIVQIFTGNVFSGAGQWVLDHV